MVIAQKTRCTKVPFKTFGLQKPPRVALKPSIATTCCQSGHKCAQSDPEECPSGAPRGPLDTQTSSKMHPRDTECARDTPEGSGGAYPSPKCTEIILNRQNEPEFASNPKQKFGEGYRLAQGKKDQWTLYFIYLLGSFCCSDCGEHAVRPFSRSTKWLHR